MGYPRLKEDRKSIISDLALSDYDLQVCSCTVLVARAMLRSEARCPG